MPSSAQVREAPSNQLSVTAATCRDRAFARNDPRLILRRADGALDVRSTNDSCSSSQLNDERASRYARYPRPTSQLRKRTSRSRRHILSDTPRGTQKCPCMKRSIIARMAISLCAQPFALALDDVAS